MEAGRVWCQSGTVIDAELKPDSNGWGAGSEILIEVLDPQRKILTSEHYTRASHLRISAIASSSGWFTLRLTGRDLPAPGATYELIVTYTGTQELAI